MIGQERLTSNPLLTAKALFVSHGAPTLPFQNHPARDFLRSLGENWIALRGRPRFILCVSAHWETERPALSFAAHPETIHDFYGFPESLYQLRYPAPGAPEQAERLAQILAAAGLPCERASDRGLDHGVWIPLMLLWPKADIPIVQMSIQMEKDSAYHLRLGEALQSAITPDMLLVASGGAVHNLRQLDRSGADGASISTPAWARGFDDWLAEALARGDRQALAQYREQAPGAVRAHPSEEHLLPLMVAFGAAGPAAQGVAVHRSFDFGSLSMASYALGQNLHGE